MFVRLDDSPGQSPLIGVGEVHQENPILLIDVADGYGWEDYEVISYFVTQGFEEGRYGHVFSCYECGMTFVTATMFSEWS